jgi:Lon protease-like protein
MANEEDIERLRQAIMRFRELLDLMSAKLEDGERAYASLFAEFTPEEQAAMKEKDLQWKAAEGLIDDAAAIASFGRAAMNMRFEARELERAFDDLYGVIGELEG